MKGQDIEMMTKITTSLEVVQTVRLNDFVHVFIQREGITYVVDNYQPIRTQYYENKKNLGQQTSQWKEDSKHV